MTYIVLDDFPPWSSYLLFGIVAISFAFALILFCRSAILSWRNQHRRIVARSSRQSLFFTIAIGIAVWFLASSLFFRFHALRIGSEAIELHFFWPRPPVRLASADLIEVKFSPAHRTCGHMELQTKGTLFRSVNFKDCKAFEAVRNEFKSKLGVRWQ